ncbi:Gfo/Idh/MocA family protein [Paenibacillus spongiae]|uniref:Gfo/Idh/MocA family oxidoreductase n=1 Tax=Paenibacillus spongiae TaxID=2909671 RepID=A0ABY5SG32_9BACL|nr:Gfo/Idh/MocA family oxidoreductase [Paenibacillus spongiae]UVI31455.1 Gfo/Idh/MocA family oxidoreductase [Paenibacillus spongiae]
MHSSPVRLAIVGGHRGAHFSNVMSYLQNEIKLVAVCDLDECTVRKWQESDSQLRGYTSYEELLNDPDVDAVFLATPMLLHARQAIQAMRAGKHVLSEVIAATTLEECWELIETVQATGKKYMLAENYCFMRPNMLIMNMVKANVFGKLTFMEGAYIHDCRSLLHDANGNMTWRGRLQRDYNGMNYPTHSFGPLAMWMGLNRDGSDRLESISTFTSPAAAVRRYYTDVVQPAHPHVEDVNWKQGDFAVSILRTASGVLIQLRLDWTSGVPHDMARYGLQGENGAYTWSSTMAPSVWVQGRSPGSSWGSPAEWESLWNYSDEFEHSWWRDMGAEADQAGHGGGDLFVIREFAAAIRENRNPVIDVYDAVLWSSIFPLSMESAAKRGAEVAIPNFRK